jgi:lipopolysaccharide biosynthesis glycosyltransferase
MVDIKSLTHNAKLIDIDSHENLNKTVYKYKCNKGSYVVCIKPKKMVNVNINGKDFTYRNRMTYCSIHAVTDDITISINRLFNIDICHNGIDNTIEYIKVFDYGNPVKIDNCKYQVLYSFDSNYFHGAFTAIYSLLYNFDSAKLRDLNVNLCVPDEDFTLVTKELNRFIINSRINTNYTLISSTGDIVDKVFVDTQCFSGGNHLLKLSNFSRLVAGDFIDCDKLLYIDSDTIVQTDMAKCLDSITDTNYVVLGKKAPLNYTNIININNVSHVLDYLGKDFDLKKSVVYTGTMIFNTKRFREFYPKMIDLVSRHNKVPNGMYKLFTMSIINLAINDDIGFADKYIKNVVDLGFKKDLDKLNNEADVLDWSGMFKPWFDNGLYKEYWIKYNIMYEKYTGDVMYMKNTKETFS